MDGFTGYNPEQATKDLNDFLASVTEIYNYGKGQFEAFNEGLLKSWYSPKAAEHSTANEIFLGSHIGVCIVDFQDAIMRTARAIIQQMALANNQRFEYSYERIGGFYDFVPLKESGPAGVGINPYIVRVTVNNFIAAVDTMCEKLENVPRTLAVYDPYGEIENLFKAKIDQYVWAMGSYLEDMCTKIDELTEGEIENQNIGVNQAVQELAG